MMMTTCDLSEIIDDICDELGIPHSEQAQREGHIAFTENRDIKQALIYWYNNLLEK